LKARRDVPAGFADASFGMKAKTGTGAMHMPMKDIKLHGL
jgi:hypothetical protein